jgi:acyl-CoA synthetase (AMP-forming)/AMP-acid ligase II
MTTTAHFGVPPADECVLRPLLEKWAARQPDKVFVTQGAGREITYRQMRDLAARTAAGLHRLGVKQGQNVVVWLPNGVDCLRVWFGINWLGATYVPINTAYRGRLLEHVLDNAGAELIVVHADLASRLAEVNTATLRRWWSWAVLRCRWARCRRWRPTRWRLRSPSCRRWPSRSSPGTCSRSCTPRAPPGPPRA